MAKRSTNFGGWKRWRRGLEPSAIVESMRRLGFSDEEIKSRLEKMLSKTKTGEKENG